MGKIIGIDLGTTNSLVAVMEGGSTKVIADASGHTLVPSVISAEEEGILVGDFAKARSILHAGKTVYSIKRFMGKGIADLKEDMRYLPFDISERDGVVRIRIGDTEYTPPEISALILKELKRRAEGYLGESVSQAVITVPAYFNDSQRQATKDAGRIAGLEVLRLVNEPTAASLAYGLNKKKQGTIAVYDLGGGTFDISILKLKDGIFEVLATNGDTHLGGDDVDRQIMAMVLEDVRKQFGEDLAQIPEAVQRIRFMAERAKCALSSKDVTTIELPLSGTGETYRRQIKRLELENLMGPLVEKTLGPCRQALKDAKLTPKDVDEVILVGGSTRIPMVRRAVAELFGQEPHCELNPDEVVAMGAAVQAQILSGGFQNMLLLDVTPLSLGIETLGGTMSVLIPRNTTIPTAAKELFTTSIDGQRSVDIHVYQGERELVAHNRSLARFSLSDIDPMPAGSPRIEVQFLIDANGILQVHAKELKTGREQSIEVKASYGLTDGEVERMIEDSFKFAAEDMKARQLIEARNEADILVRTAEKELGRAGDLISDDEKASIKAALAACRAARDGDDHNAVRQKIAELDQATRHLAEVLMDKAVQGALKNRKLSDVR